MSQYINPITCDKVILAVPEEFACLRSYIEVEIVQAWDKYYTRGISRARTCMSAATEYLHK
jgi:hypothetical protein